MKEKVHHSPPFEKPALSWYTMTSVGTISPSFFQYPLTPFLWQHPAALVEQIYIFMASAWHTKRFRMHAN